MTHPTGLLQGWW